MNNNSDLCRIKCMLKLLSNHNLSARIRWNFSTSVMISSSSSFDNVVFFHLSIEPNNQQPNKVSHNTPTSNNGREKTKKVFDGKQDELGKQTFQTLERIRKMGNTLNF